MRLLVPLSCNDGHNSATMRFVINSYAGRTQDIGISSYVPMYFSCFYKFVTAELDWRPL